MPTFSTPEEAARAAFGGKDVRFVGAVVRGDQAVVAHWVEGYDYSDTETTNCFRDGREWTAASSSNSNGAHIITAPDRVTFVYWGQAPEGAVAVRFSMRDTVQVAPVEDGFFFTVFDDLPYQEPRRTESLLPPDGSALGYMRVDTRRSRRTTPVEERRAREVELFGYEQPRFIDWVFGSAGLSE